MAINLREYGYKDQPTEEKKNFEQLPPGGYVCKIFDARCDLIENKGYRLSCDVDIDEGEFKGYFAAKRRGNGWDFNARFIRYVDGNGFNKFMRVLEKCNKNFKFDADLFEADDLRALKCGFTFGEKEYRDKLGFLRRTVNIRFPETIDNIRAGKFKVPPLQPLPENQPPPKKEDDGDNDFLENAKEVFDAEVDDFPF